ncbi:MAG: hypothetical protein C0622_01465 [Desulfuromonas sp.]|nr:MAG: hypothetical protein C0622_01465 [Desulfuromonas sp.]
MQMNLTLGVADPEQSREFYREILDLPARCFSAEGAGEGYFVLCFSNLKVVFQSLEQMESQHPALLQHLSRSLLGVGVQLELDCPDLDRVERLAERYGWPVLYELDDREHGRRELWLQDPDGYLLILNGEVATSA